jgi:diacylglycerol kinase (ATP)
MDVGFVNQRPFFECVGIGLDAAIFPLSEEIKSGGFWKWIDLFRRAIKYPRQTFEIELDRPLREALSHTTPAGRPARRWQKWLKSNRHYRTRLRALMITVSNGPYYGMNFAVAPDARIDDGLLTITIFKKYSKLELWWHYLSISSGRRIYAPRLVTLTATRIRVSGPRRLAVHLDGSTLGDWPVEISVVANRLLIFGDPNPKK